MAILLIVIGFILIILGLAGAVVPGLPGPPLSYFGLVMLELAADGRIFTNNFFIALAVIIAVVTVVENILPVAAAKAYGASRPGIWGAIVGLILGLFFFPPFGLIIGSFIGALAGEALAGKKGPAAVRAGLATLVGNAAAAILKLVLSAVIAYYFISRLI
ncbi:MAG: DUF456 domain-containing protein [Planctomycetes bacterium]|jgi:hypothetical protein|nr:DUF456 domain-containing protein [Planctomycetota bacterium]